MKVFCFNKQTIRVVEREPVIPVLRLLAWSRKDEEAVGKKGRTGECRDTGMESFGGGRRGGT